jgi:hypothetical protein
MLLGYFSRRQPETLAAPVDGDAGTDRHDDDTDLQQSAPMRTKADESEKFVINSLGAMRSPADHAAMLLDMIRGAGFDGRSVLATELEDCHALLCEQLGWIPRRWHAVGRELKRLGVRKGKVWLAGQRLTIYEIGPPISADNVVAHATVERRRA